MCTETQTRNLSGTKTSLGDLGLYHEQVNFMAMAYLNFLFLCFVITFDNKIHYFLKVSHSIF